MNNREYKFRAYDNKNKQWLMGYELENLGGFSLFGECMLLGEWSKILDTFLFDRFGYKPDDLIVMQYTGLKDRNSKECYEDDIFEAEELEFESDVLKYKIIFHTGTFWGRDSKMNEYPLKDFRDIEIIGNIYENPNLLSNPKI